MKCFLLNCFPFLWLLIMLAVFQLMVLSLFKGMGNCIFQVQAVKSLLLELMERRQKYHLGTDSLHQNLSTHEIETLCLLLEVTLVSLIFFQSFSFRIYISTLCICPCVVPFSVY